MSPDIITILAFSVIIPMTIGLSLYRRLPPVTAHLTILCFVWLMAEILSYILRMKGIVNASVSYVLTAIEIYFFCYIYAHLVDRRIKKLLWMAFILPAIDWLLFRSPLNTFSLIAEYLTITTFAVIYYFRADRQDYAIMNTAVLFYMISSAPYLFAWAWLSTMDISVLRMLGDVHAVVHCICYLIFTFVIWRSALSYSVR